jgi:hypothetical protein
VLRYAAPALLFAASFVSALLVLAPARLLGLAIEHATEGRLTLASTSGTIWRGHAYLAGTISGITIPVSWSASSIGVFTPQFSADVRIANAEPIEFTVKIDRIELVHVDVALPMPLIAELMQGISGYQFEGIVRLRADHINIGRQSVTGHLVANWTNAGTGMIDVAPLGSFDINCDMRGLSGTATLKSTAGPLLANGNARWSKSNRSANIEMRAEGPRAKILEAWLRTVAAEKPPGTFRITWSARAR